MKMSLDLENYCLMSTSAKSNRFRCYGHLMQQSKMWREYADIDIMIIIFSMLKWNREKIEELSWD